LLTGCELTPEDQWPVIAAEAVDANFTITVTQNQELGIVLFRVGKDSFDLTLDVMSYNANQGFDVNLVLKSIDKYATDYAGSDLVSQGGPFMTESSTTRYADVIGEYISGTPPQGIARIVVTNSPPWFPTSFGDWVSGTSITDKYVYNYIVTIQDMDGRTDSWEFSITSALAL